MFARSLEALRNLLLLLILMEKRVELLFQQAY